MLFDASKAARLDATYSIATLIAMIVLPPLFRRRPAAHFFSILRYYNRHAVVAWASKTPPLLLIYISIILTHAYYTADTAYSVTLLFSFRREIPPSPLD